MLEQLVQALSLKKRRGRARSYMHEQTHWEPAVTSAAISVPIRNEMRIPLGSSVSSSDWPMPPAPGVALGRY